MEERKLYPMKFCAIQDDYSWGCEIFRLADLGYRDSLVKEGWLAGNAIGELMDMYMDQLVGEKAFSYWGRQFPLCLKHIKVKGRMPLRVHPGDEAAQQRWDFLGKEKLWYVLSCSKNASVMLGFRRATDASEVYSKCSDGTIGDILNIVAPHPGQLFHIPPGTPHAATGEMDILEISESSPLDFCMSSWGELVSEEEFDPALNFVDVMDLVEYGRFSERLSTQFEASKLLLSGPIMEKRGDEDAFVILCCLSGKCSVKAESSQDVILDKGEVLLIPADCPDFALAPMETDTQMLRVTASSNPDVDSYINPSVPESLPDSD